MALHASAVCLLRCVYVSCGLVCTLHAAPRVAASPMQTMRAAHACSNPQKWHTNWAQCECAVARRGSTRSHNAHINERERLCGPEKVPSLHSAAREEA